MAGLSCRSRHVFVDNRRDYQLLIPQTLWTDGRFTRAPRMKWTEMMFGWGGWEVLGE